MTPPGHSLDTIVAVSSPPGRSPRGLIRFSGPDTRRIIAALIDDTVNDLPPRRVTTVRLTIPPMPALLSLSNAPHSYTGQDTAELQVPGNPALLDRLLHLAIHTGARLAEPGEFTFRAFLAGKLDLTQAEGVAATINATSEGQLNAAKHLTDGELGTLARNLVDDLGTRLALVEAGIDFTDQEDVVPITPADLHTHLNRIQTQLTNLLANSRSWGEVQALPRVVLMGAPSAGKSTLFNALLGQQRAVIHPIPGTTRDALCEPMTLTAHNGTLSELLLVDIAGLTPTSTNPVTPLEQKAQAAAQNAIDRADLILYIIDPTQPQNDPPPHTNTPTLTIHTKSDLPQPSTTNHQSPIQVSALTGQNLDTLKNSIANLLGDLPVSISAHMLALQPRHEHAIRSALTELTHARQRLSTQLTHRSLDDVELIADHLRLALNGLAALGGQLTPDDVIGKVFATFCVGK
jgi:tRNA modification GTPase